MNFLCKGFLMYAILMSFFLPPSVEAKVNLQEVPPYVTAGLREYGQHGYEAAVHTWLKGSAFAAGSQMASRIAFFKNIEMLAGKYQSYTILFTQQTVSSNQVYVRMNYERLPGFILFTSIKKNNAWVLGRIQLSRIQEYGSGG
jgi:hypothetical protein